LAILAPALCAIAIPSPVDISGFGSIEENFSGSARGENDDVRARGYNFACFFI
jgi:hypothetical protein